MVKVSVIVPVYKVERFIERCARSLFEQTLEGMEFIFVDDCTPDKSMEILSGVMADYPAVREQVRVVRHPENRGLPSARNSGLAIARGEYITHCDSDDWVEPGIYEKMYLKAKAAGADLVGCDFYYEYSDRREFCRQDFDVSPEDSLANLLKGKHIMPNTWCRLVKRRLYTDYQVSFVPGINMCEDLIASVKLHAFAGKTASVHEALYHYVQYNASSIASSVNDRQIKEIHMACRVIEDFLKQQGIYDNYRLAFLERVFWLKRGSLLDKKIRNYKYWKSVYPESNRNIWHYSFSLDVKLGYWLAVAGIPFFIIRLFELRRILKKMLRK